MDYVSQTTDFKRNERVCKALSKKYELKEAIKQMRANPHIPDDAEPPLPEGYE